CATAAEVAACVRFAADAAVPLAVRAGGHSYGGWSRGRGLMVDTRGLASVSVDHGAGLARIGAGASLIDVYTALGRQGVAVAGGSCPTVGLTGLSLGGGLGVLNRSFGLTCDAIRAVSIVTADGHERSVDARTEPDLFWALRGGGGGFGAVTGLTMQVRPAPTLSTFYLQFPSSAAADVLAGWLPWVLRAPRALWSTCKLLAEGADGSTRVTVSGTWAASPSGLDAALAPLLRTLPAPLTREVARRSYVDTMLFEAGCAGQSAASCTADALRAPTRQPFAATSSVVTAPLAAAAVEAAVSSAWAARSVPGIVEGGASFDALGGAVADVAPGASAFVHRRAQAIVQYTATWPAGTPAGGSAAAPYDSYVRRFRATMSRWLGTSAYCNYADPSIADYGPAYWGANYPRLQQVKAHYDPDGRFSFAQSVRR
ncbi:MAG: FAD-binding protein, partial [Actinomycetota bacterium]|nr:FAD-binding protein [Actinomycetota bacterium]